MAYTPTVWTNDSPPPLSAGNLNKLTDAIQAKAEELGISHSLPTWVDGYSPALTDAAPLNEMESVVAETALALGLSYAPTTWSAGWTPARNAARFNKLEAQVAANSTASVPTGFLIDTWEAVGHPSSDNIAQAFPVYYQDNLAKGWWGQRGVDFITEIQTPMYDGTYHNGEVIGSWEWWFLYQIWIDPAWTLGDEGNQYCFPLDLHNAPGDVGWGDPDVSGVSAVHTKYHDGAIQLQHQPNFPNHEWIVQPNISKGTWHSVLGQLILGRTDGRVSGSGHPNGGMGRTRIWVDGAATPFDTGNVNNLHYRPSDGKVQTRMDCLSGAYWPGMGSAHTGRFVTARWGRTFVEARDSLPIFGHIDDHPDITLTQIASRSSSDFILPPGF